MKKQMRKDILLKRSSMERENVCEKSSRIKSKLFSIKHFVDSKTILFYISFRNEVDTLNMIQECMNSGERIIVPVVVPGRKELLLSELKSFDELSLSTYGILEPREEFLRPVDTSEIDVVVVPGVAFDEMGYRLGYGGGYYDRLIKKLPSGCLTIGLAFEIQIVNEVPRELYDMSVDMIITEERIIKPN